MLKPHNSIFKEPCLVLCLGVRFVQRLLHRNMIKSDKEIAQAKAEANAKLHSLYDSIMALAEDTVSLYDRIEDYFFQDIDYRYVVEELPPWMIDAGRSPESPLDKQTYEDLRSIYNDSASNRVIHWIDVQGLLNAFQDRIVSVKNHLIEVYKYIPAYFPYKDKEIERSTRGMDDTADKVHTAINNVFVSLYSAFDLLTKVVYECSHYDSTGFDSYKKLKSRKDRILYDKSRFGFDELKEEGLLYSEPVCVRTVCSFRDEFIHNGSWDYRCAIYYPYVDDEPVEPFVVMPDVDDEGHLVTSGSRNKFYAKSDKINVVLPELVKGIVEVLSKTQERLKEVLVSRTKPLPKKEREKNAVAYMKVLSGNLSKLVEVFKQKS